MKTVLPGGGGGGIGFAGVLIVVGIGIVGWLATGIYTVDEGERGVELVLGDVVGLTSPGLNYNLPYPIGEVYKPQSNFSVKQRWVWTRPSPLPGQCGHATFPRKA